MTRVKYVAITAQSPVIGTVAANHAAGNSAKGVALAAVLNYPTGVKDDAVRQNFEASAPTDDSNIRSRDYDSWKILCQ